MDKQTYMQLDRMEQKIDHAIEGIKLTMNLDSVDTLENWYEEEVLNPKGKLHHLKDDEKLKTFIESLVKTEETTSENHPPKDSEEYRQP